jgi:hypothetical protein
MVQFRGDSLKQFVRQGPQKLQQLQERGEEPHYKRFL